MEPAASFLCKFKFALEFVPEKHNAISQSSGIDKRSIELSTDRKSDTELDG